MENLWAKSREEIEASLDGRAKGRGRDLISGVACEIERLEKRILLLEGRLSEVVGPEMVLTLSYSDNNVVGPRRKIHGKPCDGCDRDEAAMSALNALTDHGRLEIFRLYCRSCGGRDPRCSCANDE